MMDTRTGEFALMTPAEWEAALAAPPRPHKVLVTATEEEIQVLSQRVRLGAQEQANRKARRQTQKASRRRNRG